jgi:hypothetical protein
MTAIRKIIENSSTSVTIDLPNEYINKKLEVLILPMDDNEQDQSMRKYDFSDLAGKLKWEGDAVAEQKKLRNEWE